MTYQSRWWQMAAVQVGGVVCLPIFTLGHAIAHQYGLISALIAVTLGNTILLLLGLKTALYSVESRLTTAECAEKTFGYSGKPFFAGVLIITMMGWFAVQLDMMGSMAGSLIGVHGTKPMNVILGGMITCLSLHGVNGMEKLANICLPLLLLTVGIAVFDVSGNDPIIQTEMVEFSGISLILAGAMGAVIDLPTFFRLAKSKKDAVIAVIILFGLAVPLLEGIGIYLATQGGSENLVQSLVREDSHFAWKIWVALFVIMAGWTTNSTNLFSAVTSLTSVVKLKENSCHLLLGVLGTALSLFPIQENLFLFLEIIGVLLAAGGGVMILNQFKSAHTVLNKIGLGFGIIAGFLGLGFMGAFGIAFATALGGCKNERN